MMQMHAFVVEKLTMNTFIHSCLNQTMRKSIDEADIDVRHIALCKEDISYFNLSSNPIISFIYEGKLYYFRECLQRLSFQVYYQKAIDDFFSTLDKLRIRQEHFKQEIPIRIHFSSTEIKVFHDYLNKKQQDSVFWKSITRVDRLAVKMNFSIWEKQHYVPEFFQPFALGDIPQQCHDIGIYFLWYMRGVCAAYRTLNIVKGEKYSYFSAVKSVSSQIVAESIGLDHMITSAEFCKIEFEDGDELLGIISNAADGNRMIDTEVQIDGSLQKELMNLNILDLICFQTDHGMDNYNVFRGNENYAVCAFDNDNPNTFLPIPSIKYNFQGCSPIVDQHGLLNRPYFSEQLFRNIQNLDILSLKKRLNPYLNKFQIAMLIFRIKRIQGMLRKTKIKNPHIILSDDQWNDQTVMAETSGIYGETYVTILLRGK